jgi:hypothetical protein
MSYVVRYLSKDGWMYFTKNGGWSAWKMEAMFYADRSTAERVARSEDAEVASA